MRPTHIHSWDAYFRHGCGAGVCGGCGSGVCGGPEGGSGTERGERSERGSGPTGRRPDAGVARRGRRPDADSRRANAPPRPAARAPGRARCLGSAAEHHSIWMAVGRTTCETAAMGARRRAGLVGVLCAVLAVAGCTGSPGAPDVPRLVGLTPEPVATARAAPRASIDRAPTAAGFAPTGSLESAHVSRITDGDTIRVVIDSAEYKLRYIGMDTPESVKPGSPVEPYAKEASAANARLVADQDVFLEKDVSETDRYGRLLRYVWLRDGAAWTMVNMELVHQGYAHVLTYPPDVKYADRFVEAERVARAAGVGLWAEPPPTVAP